MRRILLFLLSFIVMDVGLFGETQRPLAELEAQAKQILSDPDNVSRRKRIEPVFELARRYAEAGRTNQALGCYSTALEHQPWNLDAQLDFAQLLQTTGQINASKEKAQLVWQYAETDGLLERSATMLDKKFTSQLPNESWTDDTDGLALVAVGAVDTWLLQDLREDLQKFLKMPVIIQHPSLNLPKSKHESIAN